MSDKIKVPLTDVTLEQAKWFCESTLGIIIHHSAKLPSVMSKLQAAHNKDFIEVPADLMAGEPEDEGDDANDAAPEASKDPREDDAYWNEYVTVLVVKQKGMQDMIPIGVNGTYLYIKPGIKSRIKRKYLHVLENAIQTDYYVKPDPENPKLLQTVSEDVPVYPVSTFAA